MNIIETPGKSITRARIIEAAVQLFARDGFAGTSVKDIARLAGLNEATMFRHFAHKPDLFVAALECCLDRVRPGRDLQRALMYDETPAIVMPLISEFVTGIVLNHPELVRLLYVAALELPAAQQAVRERLGPVFDAICGYFERCTVAGTLPNMDPSALILGFAGAVVAHHGLHRFFTDRELSYASAQQAAAFYSRFLPPASLAPRVASTASPALEKSSTGTAKELASQA